MLADRAGIALKPTPHAERRPLRATAPSGTSTSGRSTRRWPGPSSSTTSACWTRPRPSRPAAISQERGITAESIEQFHLGLRAAGARLDPAAGGRQRAAGRRSWKPIGVLGAARGRRQPLRSLPRPGAVLDPRRPGPARSASAAACCRSWARTSPAKYVNSPETPLFSKSQPALRARRGPRRHPQEPHRAGDGGLHRLHRGPPVRLRQRGGRAGHRLGREPHPHPQAVRRPDRAGARRRRGRARSGPTRCSNCSSPSRSICGSSRCPTTSTRAISCTSAGAEAFAELLAEQAGRRPGACLPRGHARASTWTATCTGRARPWSGWWRSWPRPRGCAHDTTRDDRLREEKILQRLAAMFRVDEAEVRRRLTALRRSRRQAARRRRRPRHAAAGTPPGSRPRTLDPCERELLELLLAHPEHWPPVAGSDRAASSLPARPCRRIYETCCRLADAGVAPTFDRLMLEFDEPAHEEPAGRTGRTGTGQGEPDRRSRGACWRNCSKTFERKEVEKQRPAQIVALREGRLDTSQETELLEQHHPAGTKPAGYFRAHGRVRMPWTGRSRRPD